MAGGRRGERMQVLSDIIRAPDPEAPLQTVWLGGLFLTAMDDRPTGAMFDDDPVRVGESDGE